MPPVRPGPALGEPGRGDGGVAADLSAGGWDGLSPAGTRDLGPGSTGTRRARPAFDGIGAEWSDPREWLLKAFQADGRDPIEAEALLPARTGSRKAQAIADLAGYNEARRIFRRLVVSGRKDLERDLAVLCTDSAHINILLDDIPGALESYDRAIAILEPLVGREGRRELAGDLARVYGTRPTRCRTWATCPPRSSCATGRSRSWSRWSSGRGGGELAGDLALVYGSKANAVWQLGDLPAAVGLYDRAIATYERLVEREGRRELAGDLARGYGNKAIAVQRLGDLPAAVGLYDRAIALCERLVEREGRRDWPTTWQIPT